MKENKVKFYEKELFERNAETRIPTTLRAEFRPANPGYNEPTATQFLITLTEDGKLDRLFKVEPPTTFDPPTFRRLLDHELAWYLPYFQQAWDQLNS